MTHRKDGVWVPESVANSLLRLDCQNVVAMKTALAIVFQQYRYGGKEARFTQEEISQRIDSSRSSVQRAIKLLKKMGVVRLKGRSCWQYGSTESVNMLTPTDAEEDPKQSVNIVTPLKRQHGDAYPTLILSSLYIRVCKGLTDKQQNIVNDVMAEAGSLLQSDPWLLTMSEKQMQKFGVEANMTFAQAASEIRVQGGRKARDFVGAVLLLRSDVRVQGMLLDTKGDL